MNYRLTSLDISTPVRIGQSAWRRSQLTEDLGDCITDHLTFDDGLALAYAHYMPRFDLLETRTIERSNSSLTVTIALEGQSSTTGVDGQCFNFVAGHSTIAAFSSVRGERLFPANQSIRQLRLIADEALLDKYGFTGLLDDINNDHSASHLFFGKHNGATQRLANSLVHLHHHTANLLDTQIAALSLLSEQTRPLLPHLVQRTGIKSDDQDRILHAREILLSQFDRSLTIAYLCVAVGTNEFKLKQGFRELFGISPHRMLTQIRMQKAWELLETGQRVSSVAYRVGYQHLSSFSAAFEQYYGRTPKSVAQRSKSDP
ncbi:helix-turn-helix domain-containing protein [Vreelandella alkaliphila]|nr:MULTISPECIES: AraC family transcriptional regulator [unclassified Halomonas]